MLDLADEGTMLLSPLFVCIAILVWPLKSVKALKETNVKFGEAVTLKCNMSYHHDIYWVKIGEDVQPKMLMVMGLKNDGALSVAWNANVTHYEGCVVDRLIGLRIFNVSSSDLGMYFCTASSKKRMEFGEGIRLHTEESQKNRSVQGNSEMASSSDGLFQTYLIIASALSCGMILMVVTIITVFVKTNREKRESDGKQKLYQI